MNESEVVIVGDIESLGTLILSSVDDPEVAGPPGFMTGSSAPKGVRLCDRRSHMGAEWWAEDGDLSCGICHPPARPVTWLFAGPSAAGMVPRALIPFDRGPVNTPKPTGMPKYLRPIRGRTKINEGQMAL